MSVSENASSYGSLPENAAVKKPLPPYGTHDVAFVFIVAVIGYLFVHLIFFGGLEIGASLFSALFFAAVLIWLRMSGVRPTRASYGYLAVGLALCAYFAVFDNYTLKLIALPLLMITAAYYVSVACGARIENGMGRFLLLDLASSLITTPFGNFTIAPRILKNFSGLKSGFAKKAGMLALGVILAVPVTIFAAGLLSAADDTFGDLYYNFMANLNENVTFTVIKLVISVPVTLYLYGMVFGSRKNAATPRYTAESADGILNKLRFIPGLTAIGALTPLIILYCVFFFVQRGYFISGLAGYLPEGWSFAEYARRGFFELCAVSGINLLVISVLMLLTGKDESGRLPLRIYSAVFALVSMALVVMSLSKMLLYIQYYGLTPKRLYTSAFMVFLLLTFALLMAKAVFPRFNCARWIVVTLLTLFISFCLMNPDALIARHNVERYRAGELPELDVQLLCGLDDSAVPYMLEALELEDSEKLKAELLIRYRGKLPLRSVNLTSLRSQRLLEENLELFGGG